MSKKAIIILFILLITITIIPEASFAEGGTGLTDILFNPSDNPETTVDSVKLLILLTVLTLAPSILILTTSFTRIIVVFSFLRNALGTQQSPPNQLLIGLALFLTLFIMQPIYSQINEEAIQPFLADEITQEEAFEIAAVPMKEFMLNQTREKDLALFLRAQGSDNVQDPMDLTLTTIIPAFAISELKTAFSIGFIIFIPFLVIDMVVSSILMSMGMFMLPPVMISLPFKVLLFVLVDGWYLVVESLIESFI
ncbi:flagellar type III secretion system pore protein FliP [Tissierella sp. Yu-01]|uniref:flagellar type III secretion system pore protein FliP n=1 Tax=Tissierella sp. Yu-01 TaxID=3035694 RepID=UPI00240D32CA|nr:flagellar type III secretion system pore protein FliP [Tissierella sp. Yu-01]WFA07887.1 flagellar type III secretion system pore protein FliP [Tissierella sp. Yu-01]